MLTRLSLVAGATAAMLAAAPAMAQESKVTGFYGTLGYSGFHATGASDFSVGGITGRMGARFSPWLGLEGEITGGVKDGSMLGRDVELKHQFAAYGVGYLPITPKADLFARVGYGKTRYDLTTSRVNGGSLNYGVGGQYFVTDKDGVRADYTRFDRRGSTLPSANVWSVSYVRRF